MQFAAAITRNQNTVEAAEQLAASIQRQLPGNIDLLAVFLTPEHREEAAFLAGRLRHDLGARVLIGCSCEGIIGGDCEIEREPGISVLAGRLPGVNLSPFHIGLEEWPSLLETGMEERLRRRTGSGHRDDTRAYLVLGDPFTTPIADFMEALDALAPGAPTVGGMASGGSRPGENVLLLNDDLFEDGAVGLRIAGAVRVETVVSQGCRPVGETMLVTRAEGNLLGALGGRPALEVARDVLNGLRPEDQALLENGLYLGIVVNEYQAEFQRGDFLVRNVLGADPETGSVAVGESVRAGQTVQFHVRDARTADEDLHLLMAHAAEDVTAPAGGLLFSCNGRGVRMFDLPNHDVRGVLEAVPETPLAGFFAAGELGPIGGKSFIHGQTASVVLFRPERETEETV